MSRHVVASVGEVAPGSNKLVTVKGREIGIFNIKGVGGVIYKAIQDREQLTVATMVTVVIIFYLVINLIVDIVCAVLDPRSRDV